MIKVDIHKVKDGEKKGTTACRVEAYGDVKEIISETCMFLENIHEALEKGGNPAVRFAFKAAVMKTVFEFDNDNDDKKDGDKS